MAATMMNLSRENAPSPIAAFVAASSTAIESSSQPQPPPQPHAQQQARHQQAMFSASDRNHIRGIVVTATGDGAAACNKTVDLSQYATSSSAAALGGIAASATTDCTGAKAAIIRADTSANSGVWEKRAQTVATAEQTLDSPVETTLSQDSTPSDDSKSLCTSAYSKASVTTVIKRSSYCKPEDTGDQGASSGRKGNMSDLPSYELATYTNKNANGYSRSAGSPPPTAPTAPGPAVIGNAQVTNRQPAASCIYAYSKNKNYDKNVHPTAPAIGDQVEPMPQQQNRLVRDSSLEPIDEDERLVQMTQAIINSQPSTRSKRTEVLRYFSAAKSFLVRVVGGDIQITDADGCPLFDAYVDLDCRKRWWNIEAYGDPVLLMREDLSFGDGASRWGSRVTITDWNGEPFGYLVTGDPMRLESVERAQIGRIYSQPAMINNASSSNVTAIPKACWVCQAGSDECREQQVARLEAYRKIVFLDGCTSGDDLSKMQHEQISTTPSNVTFHLKLMALAAMIRLVGALTVTPVADCLALTKFFLNCCAYK